MRAITTAVVLIAALSVGGVVVVGCGGSGGPRRMRLTSSGGGTVDGATDGVPLPAFMCSGSIPPLNCAAPFIPPADGYVTDFSNREWSSTSGKPTIHIPRPCMPIFAAP